MALTVLVTTAEAGGRGGEGSTEEKGVGEEMWMKGKHLQHVEHCEEQLATSRAPNKGPGAKEEMEKIHSAGNRHDCSHEEDSRIQGDLI